MDAFMMLGLNPELISNLLTPSAFSAIATFSSRAFAFLMTLGVSSGDLALSGYFPSLVIHLSTAIFSTTGSFIATDWTGVLTELSVAVFLVNIEFIRDFINENKPFDILNRLCHYTYYEI